MSRDLLANQFRCPGSIGVNFWCGTRPGSYGSYGECRRQRTKEAAGLTGRLFGFDPFRCYGVALQFQVRHVAALGLTAPVSHSLVSQTLPVGCTIVGAPG